MPVEFIKFPSISRLSREVVVTEKLDGTNAQIRITEDGQFLTGCRTRWITPEDDNYGFSLWAHEHKDALMALGVGFHFGEWWGQGIGRKYTINEKRFSLFNVGRWSTENIPACCHVVPTLYIGEFCTTTIQKALDNLKRDGSSASPGFMKPEGIVIFHKHSGTLFKKTFEGDDKGKSYGN